MKRIEHTERTDKLIIAAYQSAGYNKGAVKKAVKATGFSIGTLHRRAAELGVVPSHRKLHSWEPWQVQLLEDNAHKSLSALNSMICRRGGPSRSLLAIAAQLKDLGLGQRQSRIDAGIYSAAQAAKLLGVTDDVIRRYINIGLLSAKQRDDITKREYSITDADLKKLLMTHTCEVNFTKIDKYWLVECLTGGQGAKK
ncbi:MerR family DNA-binding transcriptional regulator [Methylomonas sp. HYX-M1]|uniref:MerR family DNA-binding transcriptional regulator n=1 Tax=Methylomonas sp. HYX-M1 TaxID=3139307 RepID=UPI00345B9550